MLHDDSKNNPFEPDEGKSTARPSSDDLLAAIHRARSLPADEQASAINDAEVALAEAEDARIVLEKRFADACKQADAPDSSDEDWMKVIELGNRLMSDSQEVLPEAVPEQASITSLAKDWFRRPASTMEFTNLYFGPYGMFFWA